MSERALERFEEACAHDRAGREADAVTCYEEALALGLDEAERPRALLGLGSTYRNLDRHEDAIDVLETAVAEYPDRADLRLFLALALRSGGYEPEGFRLLGELVVAHADLHGYARAASYYLAHLDAP